MGAKSYITVSIFCLFLLKAVSQTIPFKNFTVRDRLPVNVIEDIAQDKKGFIWLATENGLVQFDGYNFKNYTSLHGLHSNFLVKIFIDSYDNIWVGDYNGGLNKLVKDSIIQINYKDKLPNSGIRDIFQDLNNRIWCSTYDGTYYVDGDSLLSIFNEDYSLNMGVLCNYVDSDGVIWISTTIGIFKFDSALVEVKRPELKNIKVTDIIQDKLGNYWFSTQSNGVFCMKDSIIYRYDTSNGLSENTTLCLVEDFDGNIYVGTSGSGINIIQPDNTIINLRDYSRDSEIISLLLDSQGRIWARTHLAGIFLIKEKDIKHISVDNGLIDNSISCIIEDLNSNIWLGSNYGGLSIYRNSVFTLYDLGGDAKSIRSVHVSKKGDLYVGTDQALFKSAPMGALQKITLNINQELYPEPYIISITEDSKENIWLGTIGGLLRINNSFSKHLEDTVFLNNWYYIWSNSLVADDNRVYAATESGLIINENNNYKLFTEDDGLISSDLYSLAIDYSGNLWCGSSEGLSIYDGATFYNFTEENGLTNNFCNDICFDSKGVAWIATDYGVTAAVLDKGYNLSTKHYTVENGLSAEIIYSILSAGKYIWMGHNKGVDRLNILSQNIISYGYLEGFLPLENNSGAIDIDTNGNIWFGTVDGLVKYDPQNDKLNDQPPLIYITEIRLHNDTSNLNNFYSETDTSTGLPKDLVLPYNHNALIFDYVGIHFKLTEKNLYKYRLLGYDDKWNKETKSISTIPYQRIPPGKYVFELKAANSDGVWIEEPVRFAFEISPPWWQTWWARAIEVSALIGLIFLIIYLRERKLRHDRDVLRHKVKERTIEIEKQKEKIEEQKKEITDSIEYAQHIQSAILPKKESIEPILKDYFILYKPRDIVSGDFYWVNGNEKRVVAIAADCTGHGVPGAFLSMLGVSILNQLNATHENLLAGQILDNLRKELINTLSHTSKGEESRDGMDMALCIIDFESMNAQFAGALNPLIQVRDQEPIIHKGDKMPVGLHFGEIKAFGTKVVELQKGDCLYLFSDGYADQFGGPNGKKFMTGKFRKLLCEISINPMPVQHEILHKTLEDWMNGTDQIDDILVMGIRI